MRPDAPLCGAVRFEGSDGCALNAGHIERGQPDHIDTCGNRWATVAPTEPPPEASRLARAPGGVLVLDTPGETIPAAALSDTDPPVDEDARPPRSAPIVWASLMAIRFGTICCSSAS